MCDDRDAATAGFLEAWPKRRWTVFCRSAAVGALSWACLIAATAGRELHDAGRLDIAFTIFLFMLALLAGVAMGLTSFMMLELRFRRMRRRRADSAGKRRS